MEHDARARTKWMSLLESSTDRETLQAMGGKMTAELLLETLEWAVHQTGEHQQKLVCIISAVPQNVFASGFSSVTESHMTLLKSLAGEEPIQHHLTLLAHKWAHEAEEQAIILERLRKNIMLYDVRDANQDDYETYKKAIEVVQTHFQQSLSLLDKALSLAWNSSRADLIDRLTTLKENWQRYALDVIGNPASEATEANGLFRELDTHFDLVFGDASNPSQLAALEDDDLGIEALAALSIWNAQDYRELGLIRQDTEVSHDQLLEVIQERLKELKLATVADFKQAKIYSKTALQKYILSKGL